MTRRGRRWLSEATRERIRAWLELFRIPNWLTVPGDALAGVLLASGSLSKCPRITAACAAGAGLALYAAGLALNDVADRAEDAVERPSRPLPSGRITVGQAWAAAAAALMLGLVLAALAGWAALAVSAALAATILVYDFGGRRVPVAGPLLMGACRGLNLLLGAVAYLHGTAPGVAVVVAAVGETLVVAGVTVVAAGETKHRELGVRRWLPVAALAAMWLVMLAWPMRARLQTPEGFGAAALAVLAVGWFWAVGHALRGRPRSVVVGRGIGAWIRGLLFVQAALCGVASLAGWGPAALLLVLVPVADWAGQQVAQS